MRKQILQQNYDEERALYALRDADVVGCVFAGPADGESALKECRGIKAHHCKFSLRYPLWHAKDFLLSDSQMEVTARAPMWYTEAGTIRHSVIDGVKALRECVDTLILDSVIRSPEFGWKCRGVKIRHSSIESEYLLLESRDVEISELTMKGKYSFQYVKDLEIRDSKLATKDAFWHAENVTVIHSEVAGEYLGWYSKNLTLIGCHVSGTQPLCYCKGLRLIDCTTDGCDLSFEYSDVKATVKGGIVSVKNPRRGRIEADAIGEIIREDAVKDCRARILVGGKLV